MPNDEVITPQETWEKICEERTEKLTSQISASVGALISKFAAVDEKIDILIGNHEKILTRHEEEIKSIRVGMGNLGEQVSGLNQWKATGERNKDVWYKRQAFITSIAVLIVGVLSNIDEIRIAIKGAVAIFGGGQ